MGPIPKPSPRRLVLTQILRGSDRKDEQGGTEDQREQGLGLRDSGARTQVTVDLDASRDDLSQPILPLFLCSSLFHLRIFGEQACAGRTRHAEAGGSPSQTP